VLLLAKQVRCKSQVRLGDSKYFNFPFLGKPLQLHTHHMTQMSCPGQKSQPRLYSRKETSKHSKGKAQSGETPQRGERRSGRDGHSGGVAGKVAMAA